MFCSFLNIIYFLLLKQKYLNMPSHLKHVTFGIQTDWFPHKNRFALMHFTVLLKIKTHTKNITLLHWLIIVHVLRGIYRFIKHFFGEKMKNVQFEHKIFIAVLWVHKAEHTKRHYIPVSVIRDMKPIIKSLKLISASDYGLNTI